MAIESRLASRATPATPPVTMDHGKVTDQDGAIDPDRRLHRILLASDLAAASDLATDWAFDLAAAHRAQLLIVSVIDPAVIGHDAIGIPSRTAARWDEVRDDRQAAAQRLVRRGREAGIGATFLVWTGDPGESIAAAAEAEAADLIIVGSHGRGRLGRLLLGSVSDYVARHAPCPVLVVRARSEQA
jgi:nucleotide-binding universal stress UspA family protein